MAASPARAASDKKRPFTKRRRPRANASGRRRVRRQDSVGAAIRRGATTGCAARTRVGATSAATSGACVGTARATGAAIRAIRNAGASIGARCGGTASRAQCVGGDVRIRFADVARRALRVAVAQSHARSDVSGGRCGIKDQTAECVALVTWSSPAAGIGRVEDTELTAKALRSTGHPYAEALALVGRSGLAALTEVLARGSSRRAEPCARVAGVASWAVAVDCAERGARVERLVTHIVGGTSLARRTGRVRIAWPQPSATEEPVAADVGATLALAWTKGRANGAASQTEVIRATLAIGIERLAVRRGSTGRAAVAMGRTFAVPSPRVG